MVKCRDSIKTRYERQAYELYGDWNVVYILYDGCIYQGGIECILKKHNKYIYFQYDYGSCYICNSRKNLKLKDANIIMEMKDLSILFDSKEEMINFINKSEMLHKKEMLENLQECKNDN